MCSCLHLRLLRMRAMNTRSKVMTCGASMQPCRSQKTHVAAHVLAACVVTDSPTSTPRHDHTHLLVPGLNTPLAETHAAWVAVKSSVVQASKQAQQSGGGAASAALHFKLAPLQRPPPRPLSPQLHEQISKVSDIMRMLKPCLCRECVLRHHVHTAGAIDSKQLQTGTSSGAHAPVLAYANLQLIVAVPVCLRCGSG